MFCESLNLFTYIRFTYLQNVKEWNTKKKHWLVSFLKGLLARMNNALVFFWFGFMYNKITFWKQFFTLRTP